MEKLVILIMLFLIGSILGWIIELVYRSVFQQKKLVNPGFLQGPYLPVYGIGTLMLYMLSSLPIAFGFKVVAFILSTTLLELVTGIFFLNVFSIRLWDYSKNRLNYNGMISPLYSFFWLVLSLIYYFFMYEPLTGVLAAIASSLVLTFILGIVCGFFILDMFQSFNMAYKIRFALIVLKKKKKEIEFNYTLFEDKVRDQLKRLKAENFATRYFTPLMNLSPNDIKEHVNNFLKIK